MKRVFVTPYDPTWPAAFDAAATELRPIVGDNLVAIHHIGSTSIPGIHAKSVIDMLVIVRSNVALDAVSPAIETLGYAAMGEFGIAGRRYFRRDNSAGDRTHQIHAFEVSSNDIDRHLAFRDYLRTQPALASEYSELKQRLVAAHPADINAYMDGKDAWIKDVQERAMRWVAKSS